MGCTPAATCHDFYFIYKRKEKKICNKRQTRVRLGAFIPQRKDRCVYCQALGSYDRVSAKPQPQANGAHNGASRSLGISARMRNKVFVACTAPHSDCTFLCWDTRSEPTSGVSAESAPRP